MGGGGQVGEPRTNPAVQRGPRKARRHAGAVLVAADARGESVWDVWSLFGKGWKDGRGTHCTVLLSIRLIDTHMYVLTNTERLLPRGPARRQPPLHGTFPFLHTCTHTPVLTDPSPSLFHVAPSFPPFHPLTPPAALSSSLIPPSSQQPSGKLCYLDFGMMSYVESNQRYGPSLGWGKSFRSSPL